MTSVIVVDRPVSLTSAFNWLDVTVATRNVTSAIISNFTTTSTPLVVLVPLTPRSRDGTAYATCGAKTDVRPSLRTSRRFMRAS